MEPNKSIQPSESYHVAAVLAITGGFLDAYTYVCRDGVFANAQTGNFCRMAISLANGHFLLAVRYLIPILSFILGISLAMLLRRRLSERCVLHWRQVNVLVEVALLTLVSLVPDGTVTNIAANVLVSFTCAVQVETFRKFLGSTFASTMCTGNLRSASENLNNYFAKGDPALRRRSLQYFGIDLLFVSGVLLGTWCTNLLGLRAVLLCCVLLLSVFFMMFIPKNKNHPANTAGKEDAV